MRTQTERDFLCTSIPAQRRYSRVTFDSFRRERRTPGKKLTFLHVLFRLAAKGDNPLCQRTTTELSVRTTFTGGQYAPDRFQPLVTLATSALYALSASVSSPRCGYRRGPFTAFFTPHLLRRHSLTSLQGPLPAASPVTLRPAILMSTLRQIEANRRNSQLSTGPRTPEGKAVSRFNALKSGVNAKAQVIPGED